MDDGKARDLLARERTRLEKALADLDRPEDDELSHADQHPADEGTELFERQRDGGFADRLRRELEALERAEQRLADGTYGRSVESGEAIPDARLEAMPSAERTVAEQSRLDRGG
jgi:DnaK suppressor protein